MTSEMVQQVATERQVAARDYAAQVIDLVAAALAPASDRGRPVVIYGSPEGRTQLLREQVIARIESLDAPMLGRVLDVLDGHGTVRDPAFVRRSEVVAMLRQRVATIQARLERYEERFPDEAVMPDEVQRNCDQASGARIELRSLVWDLEDQGWSR